MSVYADSSALVKLYSNEPGFEAIGQIADVVVSCVARVEVPAAIWRKSRIGEIHSSQARILTSSFEIDYLGHNGDPPRFVVMTLPADILEEAARFVAVHGLRAYDAVQLASSTAARRVDPACQAFACFDDTLREAAATEGFTIIP